MRFIKQGDFNNGRKFPAGFSLICFFLAGLMKTTEGGYVLSKVRSFSSDAPKLIQLWLRLFIKNSFLLI